LPEKPCDLPPIPPVEPRPEQCCRTGCDPCIYDLYMDELERYELAREAWEKRQAAAESVRLGGT
jgi:Oxidoreductase-like protein, N-terminal